jgi:hypothetical protein
MSAVLHLPGRALYTASATFEIPIGPSSATTAATHPELRTAQGDPIISERMFAAVLPLTHPQAVSPAARQRAMCELRGRVKATCSRGAAPGSTLVTVIYTGAGRTAAEMVVRRLAASYAAELRSRRCAELGLRHAAAQAAVLKLQADLNAARGELQNYLSAQLIAPGDDDAPLRGQFAATGEATVRETSLVSTPASGTLPEPRFLTTTFPPAQAWSVAISGRADKAPTIAHAIRLDGNDDSVCLDAVRQIMVFDRHAARIDQCQSMLDQGIQRENRLRNELAAAKAEPPRLANIGVRRHETRFFEHAPTLAVILALACSVIGIFGYRLSAAQVTESANIAQLVKLPVLAWVPRVSATISGSRQGEVVGRLQLLADIAALLAGIWFFEVALVHGNWLTSWISS